MSGNKGKKLEPPFGLDMDFEEALRRFARTKPSEVEASIQKSKKKKPHKAKKKRKSPGSKNAPPGTIGKSQSVISLRGRRMKKHNGR